MAGATSFTQPSPGLSVALLSKKIVNLIAPKDQKKVYLTKLN